MLCLVIDYAYCYEDYIYNAAVAENFASLINLLNDINKSKCWDYSDNIAKPRRKGLFI
ncbi:hypothetical protein PAAL109150_05895 [Paenibacillus alkaliterrae]